MNDQAEIERLRDRIRALEAENADLRRRPYRCNDYPSCKCNAYEACLP